VEEKGRIKGWKKRGRVKGWKNIERQKTGGVSNLTDISDT